MQVAGVEISTPFWVRTLIKNWTVCHRDGHFEGTPHLLKLWGLFPLWRSPGPYLECDQLNLWHLFPPQNPLHHFLVTLIIFLLAFLIFQWGRVVTVGNRENKGSGEKLDFKAFSKRRKKKKKKLLLYLVTYHIFLQLKIRSMVIWNMLYLEVWTM